MRFLRKTAQAKCDTSSNLNLILDNSKDFSQYMVEEDNNGKQEHLSTETTVTNSASGRLFSLSINVERVEASKVPPSLCLS